MLLFAELSDLLIDWSLPAVGILLHSRLCTVDVSQVTQTTRKGDEESGGTVRRRGVRNGGGQERSRNGNIKGRKVESKSTSMDV